MKLFAYILLPLISLTACTATAQSDEYVINGKTAAEKVYLQRINDRGAAITVDSAAVRNGTFQLQGKTTDGGGFYQLNFLNGQKTVLILEGGETLTVDATAPAAPGQAAPINVTGSKNMEYYARLNQIKDEFQKRTQVWGAQFEALDEKKDAAKRQKIQQDFERAQAEVLTKVRALFPEMGTSLVALYATNFLNSEADLPFLLDLADRFEKEKPNSGIGQAFIASVRRSKAVAEGLPIGQAAPEINLKAPDDKVVTLSSLRGKYVLIDFWASWCGPCRRENPNVVRLYNQYKNKGFEIYGVSLDRDRAPWLKAIKDDNLSWTHVSDLKYFNSAAALDYMVQAIPYTVLLDKEGKIIAKGLRGQALEEKLAELLN
jgi:thiol-disulfide isomerase/thioredoxin